MMAEKTEFEEEEEEEFGAGSRAFPPSSDKRPEARFHVFGFASCSRGLAFPDGDIAGPNSNTAFDPTPQAKWCYSGSLHPIFHCGPLRRLPWTTCHILARSST